jgi:hypothetical protein
MTSAGGVRYLIVETGDWLSSRKVLISPFSVHKPNWAEKILPVSISQQQVRNSPDTDTQKPVSRQFEEEFLGYYGYPSYWGGSGLWGEGYYPSLIGATDSGDKSERAEIDRAHANAEKEKHRNDDPHLRSCKAVIGYDVHATDGNIGHVKDMLVDEETWAIRYLVVDTSNWWMGHTVLIAPPWIKDVRWTTRTVSVHMTRELVKTAPTFVSTDELNRLDEISLHRHYGRDGYWTERSTPHVNDFHKLGNDFGKLQSEPRGRLTQCAAAEPARQTGPCKPCLAVPALNRRGRQ